MSEAVNAGTADKAPVVKKAVAPLRDPVFKLAAYVREAYAVTVEPGVTIADIIKPDFWMHVAAKLRPSDHIEVYFADGTMYAELLVVSANRNSARVAIVHEVDLRLAGQVQDLGAELADYSVTWGGPVYKYRVVKKGVVEPIKTGFESKAAAQTWLVQEYLAGNTKVAA